MGSCQQRRLAHPFPLQHFVDALRMDETPVEYLLSRYPESGGWWCSSAACCWAVAAAAAVLFCRGRGMLT